MDLPEKRYFTIGEVSTLCDLKPHVLRYWEQEFVELRPNKRRGNRRYYRREDLQTIQQIKHLLYEKGFTISGARSQLLEFPVGAPHEASILPHEAPTSFPTKDRDAMRVLLTEALDILL